jgi:SanA protein
MRPPYARVRRRVNFDPQSGNMRLWPTGRRKKLVFVTLASLMGGAALFLGINAWVYSKGKAGVVDISTATKADAILVLGAYTYESGMVSPILRDRLLVALELYQKELAPKILVSGDHGENDYDEVNAMRRFLEERGVPAEDIFMDHAGFDTYNSLIRARDIFEVQSLLIVTQEFHLTRAIYIGRALGLRCEGVTSDLAVYPSLDYLKKRELLARIKAFGEVLWGQEPVFGGETHPISGDGTVTHDLPKDNKAGQSSPEPR